MIAQEQDFAVVHLEIGGGGVSGEVHRIAPQEALEGIVPAGATQRPSSHRRPCMVPCLRGGACRGLRAATSNGPGAGAGGGEGGRGGRAAPMPSL